MKQLILIAILLFGHGLIAQTNLYSFNKALKEKPNEIAPFAIVYEGPETIRTLEAEHILIKTVTKDWVYITSTAKRVGELKAQGKIKNFHFEFSVPALMNDSSRQKHFVNEVHAGSNGLETSYLGREVIVGYVDDGLGFDHPDFSDENGKTRVIKYWDHTNQADAARIPAAYGYGQVYDSSDINNGTFIVAGAPNHGTTVTGAGSGNGRANGTNRGMAPESKIIFVKSNFAFSNWTLSIADAVDFIFKQADTLGLPAIVNLSLGNYFGSHDGLDAATKMIDALLDEKTGRIVVAATGNGGEYGNFHVRGEIDADTSFVWLKPNPENNGFGMNTIFFDLWGWVSEVENIDFAFGANLPSGSYAERGQTIFRNVATSFATQINDVIVNDLGDTLAELQIYADVQDTAYNMFVVFTVIDSTAYNYSFKTKGSGRYDMWTGANYGFNSFVDAIPTEVEFPAIVYYNKPDSLQSIVSEWNCSSKVVSVGNFQNRVGYINLDGDPQTFSATFARSGELAYTSSIGPTRDDRMKPDVSAAGDGSLSPSSMAFLQTPALSFLIDSSGWFGRNGGTSMSAPVVAGIAALYFEKCPNMTYANFLEELKATCYTDGFTGAVPNVAYGYGKVHALNLLLNNPRPIINFTAVDSVCTDGTKLALFATPNGGIFSGTNVTGSTFDPAGLEFQNIKIEYAVSDKYGCFQELDSVLIYVDTCKTIGLELLNGQEQLLIEAYPNPTTGLISCKGISPKARLELYDLNGRSLEFRKLSQETIDISNLKSGLYNLKIYQDQQVVNIKVWRL